MGNFSKFPGILAIAVVLVGCLSLKFSALKGTSVPNPPSKPVKVFITEFPVVSKASIVDPTAAVSSSHAQSGLGQTGRQRERAGNLGDLGGLVGNARDLEIARPSRIEDLAGPLLRELRRDKVRIFFDYGAIPDLEGVREFDNPFELVDSESDEAELEISGTSLIRSRRVSKKFTRTTDSVEITLSIKDLKTGRVIEKEMLRLGIRMVFNSEELEEAMVVGVVTHLMQKTLL